MSGSGEMGTNETIIGKLIGWFDENTPVLELPNGDQVQFDVGGFDAEDEEGPCSSSYDVFRIGDVLRVQQVREITFLRRGEGINADEWVEGRQ